MNWFIIAAAILAAAGIFSLIKYLTNNRKEEIESQATTPQPERRIGSKMGYGKMWNWIILIAIISALVLGFWIVPKYLNGKISRASVNATFIWTLDPSQYGQKRTSGPQRAEITRDDSKIFNFVVYYDHKGKKGKSTFEGDRTAIGNIKGFWWQDNPKDGGEWHLKPDPVDKRLLTGEYSDNFEEWTPMKLVLKLN